MTDAAIRMVNITKRFGNKTILNDINLDILSGEILGIIGMSGSGKTTLLNAMIGFLQPEMGDILFKMEHLLNIKDSKQYRSIFSDPHDIKTMFGFSSQEPSIYSKLTTYENLDYFGRLYNLPKSVRQTNIDILLHLMKLNDSRKVAAGSLSGGMQKRLDIACALIHDPKILILDEPTSNLDPILRKEMWNFIREINKKGTTIILSSHFLDELESYCDRISILYNSEITITESPSEIKRYYAKEQEISIQAEKDYDEIIEELQNKDSLKITGCQVHGRRLMIRSANVEEALKFILKAGYDLQDITVTDPSLQDVLETINEGYST
ncbi:MAG: ABC transporter ATP-binding protein [Candidatus Woesearchaeota archaeon]